MIDETRPNGLVIHVVASVGLRLEAEKQAMIESFRRSRWG
jgi:hypothetical protein